MVLVQCFIPKNRQNGSEILKTSSGNNYEVTQVSIMSGKFNDTPQTRKQKDAPATSKQELDSDIENKVNNIEGESPKKIVATVRKQRGLITLSEQEVLIELL